MKPPLSLPAIRWETSQRHCNWRGLLSRIFWTGDAYNLRDSSLRSTLSLRILTVTVQSQKWSIEQLRLWAAQDQAARSPITETAQVPRLPGLHPSLRWRLSDCAKFCITCKAGLWSSSPIPSGLIQEVRNGVREQAFLWQVPGEVLM